MINLIIPNQCRKTMLENLLWKCSILKKALFKSENTWIWSLLAIFALLFTAFILLFNFIFVRLV